MTAEIVIMNKSAIALAADSAVTIGHKERKIYNTVNKLFALSKYHPVGIMIYDSADIMDIPWETVIKEFRKYLKDRRYDKLIEYYDDFVSFIETENIIFTKECQQRYYYNLVSVYFYYVQQSIDKKVKSITDCNGGITEAEVVQITNDTIDELFKKIRTSEFLPEYDEKYIKEVITNYKAIISDVAETIFDKRPINKSSSTKLIKMAGYLAGKNAVNLGKTGVVIAGFGDKEVFPSVIDFNTEFILNNKLKKYKFRQRAIDLDNTAQIMPFAQFEMPYRFMEGIDPFYSEVIENYIEKMLDGYKDVLVDNFSKLSDKAKKNLKKELDDVNETILSDIIDKLQDYRNKNYVSPVLQAVAVLPKDELAAMAESLVHITSLKRKFSMDQETVAGPIDVAIISKGDGLVWIKRKHYFNQDLNRHFMANYFK